MGSQNACYFIIETASTCLHYRREAPEQHFAVGPVIRRPRLSVAATDLNGDGNPDLVTANHDSNDVSVLPGNGDGTFQPQHRFNSDIFGLSVAVAVADLNGDGFPDLVASGNGGLSILLHR